MKKIIILSLLCLTFAKAENDATLEDIQKALTAMDEPYRVDFMDKKPKEAKQDHTTIQIIGVSALILFVSIFAAASNEK